jgi:choline kinase
MLPAAALEPISSLALENRPPPLSSSTGPPPRHLASTVAAARAASYAPSQPPMLEEDIEIVRKNVEKLLWETRVWRGLNSAQWVLWGIVQAKIPGLNYEDLEKTPRQGGAADPHPQAAVKVTPDDSEINHDQVVNNTGETGGEEADQEREEEEGFDYLAYARDRARFFWGDVISFNIMKQEELPQEVVSDARILDY